MVSVIFEVWPHPRHLSARRLHGMAAAWSELNEQDASLLGQLS